MKKELNKYLDKVKEEFSYLDMELEIIRKNNFEISVNVEKEHFLYVDKIIELCDDVQLKYNTKISSIGIYVNSSLIFGLHDFYEVGDFDLFKTYEILKLKNINKFDGNDIILSICFFKDFKIKNNVLYMCDGGDIDIEKFL